MDLFLLGAEALSREMGISIEKLAAPFSDVEMSAMEAATALIEHDPVSCPARIGAILICAEKCLQKGNLSQCNRYIDEVSKRLVGREDVKNFAMPRLLWLRGEIASQFFNNYERAIDYFSTAIQDAQEQGQVEVLMLASLGRAIAKRKHAREEGTSWQDIQVIEAKEDLLAARRFAKDCGRWQIEATSLRELGRIESCSAVESSAYFTEAIDIVLENASPEEAARRTAKICRSAVDRYLVTADLEYMCRYVKEALSIPERVLGLQDLKKMENFQTVCDLLDNVTVEFVLGCAICHYQGLRLGLTRQMLRELDHMIQIGRVKRVKNVSEMLGGLLEECKNRAENLKLEDQPGWESWEQAAYNLGDLLYLAENELHEYLREQSPRLGRFGISLN